MKPKSERLELEERRRAALLWAMRYIAKHAPSQDRTSCDRALVGLQLLWDGHDARKYFGIRAKRGSHPLSFHQRDWIVQDFYRGLRAIEPKKLKKIHIAQVADVSGLSKQSVQRIIANTAANPDVKHFNDWSDTPLDVLLLWAKGGFSSLGPNGEDR